MTAQRDVKAVWYSGPPELPQLGHRITMLEARDAPCNGQCPWLAANHGTPRSLYNDHEVAGVDMPGEPFDFAPWKRVELWNAELKEGAVGYSSLCHIRLKGTEKRADDSWQIVGRQCTGALVMQQRELLRFLVDGKSALSPAGAANIASAMLDRPVAVEELDELSRDELRGALHPALTDPEIGCIDVAAAIDATEIRRWRIWLDAQT